MGGIVIAGNQNFAQMTPLFNEFRPSCRCTFAQVFFEQRDFRCTDLLRDFDTQCPVHTEDIRRDSGGSAAHSSLVISIFSIISILHLCSLVLESSLECSGF